MNHSNFFAAKSFQRQNLGDVYKLQKPDVNEYIGRLKIINWFFPSFLFVLQPLEHSMQMLKLMIEY